MKYWIITILSLQSFLAEAQKMDTVLAGKLLEKEVLFFVSQTDSEKYASLIDKAGLQRSHGNYEKALTELDRAEPFSSDEKRKTALKYEKMLNYFLSDQFSQCASVEFTSEEAARINKRKEYFSMRFFSLNETEQWSKCREELLTYCTSCDSNNIRQISSLPVTYDYINPEHCKKLSSFVPGLGIAQAGKPFKAATSVILQAGFAVFAGYNFYAGYYAMGIVSGVFPLMKFHKGGNRLSTRLAYDRNEKEKRKLKALYSEEIKKVVHQ